MLVATKPAVRLADPHADRARPGKLVLIAIAAAGLGFAIAIASTGRAPSARLLEDAGLLDSPTYTSPGELARVLPRPAASPQAVDYPPPLAAEPARATIETEREHSVAVDARPSPKRAFESGIVAYMRCDGLERARRRYPCPRDRELEEHVWRALAGLNECSAADPGQGRAEVRLTLQQPAAPRVEFRPPAEGPSLDLAAVSTCAGAQLAQARSHLRTPLAVVSFRFRLQ